MPPHAPDALLVLPGEAEIFKLGVHLGVFGLVAACAAYNAMAFSHRRQRHLLINTVVYLGIAYWESHQMARHFDTLQQTR